MIDGRARRGVATMSTQSKRHIMTPAREAVEDPSQTRVGPQSHRRCFAARRWMKARGATFGARRLAWSVDALGQWHVCVTSQRAASCGTASRPCGTTRPTASGIALPCRTRGQSQLLYRYPEANPMSFPRAEVLRPSTSATGQRHCGRVRAQPALRQRWASRAPLRPRLRPCPSRKWPRRSSRP